MLCFWEDDAEQLRFPDLGNQTNFVPLREAQQNYAQFGAIEQRFAQDVRKPNAADARDPDFRAILPSDSFEDGPSDAEGPSDTTELYYWRPTFWRLTASRHPVE